MKPARFFCRVTAAAAVALGGMAQGADVLLTYDLRIADLQPSGVSRIDAHHASVSALGDVVSLDLYAVIRNADGNQATDGFLTGQGSLVSSATSSPKLQGKLRGAGTPTTVDLLNNVSPFDSTGATSGAASAYEGDGRVDDVGSSSTAAGAVNDWFAATAGSDPVLGSSLVAGDLSQLIGRTTFTVDLDPTGRDALLNFLPRIRLTGSPQVQALHLFTSDEPQDGSGDGSHNYALRGDDPRIAHLGSLISGPPGTPVVDDGGDGTPGIPEPSSLVLLALGGVGLLWCSVRSSRFAAGRVTLLI